MEFIMWTPEGGQEAAWVTKWQVPGDNPIDDINHLRTNANFSTAQVQEAFGEVMAQAEAWHNDYVSFCADEPSRDELCDYVIAWALSW